MRQTCLNMVHELAKRDKRPLFIGSDLSPGLVGHQAGRISCGDRLAINYWRSGQQRQQK